MAKINPSSSHPSGKYIQNHHIYFAASDSSGDFDESREDDTNNFRTSPSDAEHSVSTQEIEEKKSLMGNTSTIIGIENGHSSGQFVERDDIEGNHHAQIEYETGGDSEMEESDYDALDGTSGVLNVKDAEKKSCCPCSLKCTTCLVVVALVVALWFGLLAKIPGCESSQKVTDFMKKSGEDIFTWKKNAGLFSSRDDDDELLKYSYDAYKQPDYLREVQVVNESKFAVKFEVFYEDKYSSENDDHKTLSGYNADDSGYCCGLIGGSKPETENFQRELEKNPKEQRDSENEPEEEKEAESSSSKAKKGNSGKSSSKTNEAVPLFVREIKRVTAKYSKPDEDLQETGITETLYDSSDNKVHGIRILKFVVTDEDVEEESDDEESTKKAKKSKTNKKFKKSKNEDHSSTSCCGKKEEQPVKQRLVMKRGYPQELHNLPGFKETHLRAVDARGKFKVAKDEDEDEGESDDVEEDEEVFNKKKANENKSSKKSETKKNEDGDEDGDDEE